MRMEEPRPGQQWLYRRDDWAELVRYGDGGNLYRIESIYNGMVYFIGPAIDVHDGGRIEWYAKRTSVPVERLREYYEFFANGARP